MLQVTYRLRSIWLLGSALLALTVWSGEDAGKLLQASGVTGGLVVHVGCGDGQVTATLRPNDRYLVQGLDTNPANVAKARAFLQTEGKYGPISVEHFDGKRLPCTDNLVNLIVVEESAFKGGDEELLRALAPRGIALFLNRQSSTVNRKLAKPWPKDIDDWTHFLHGADGNAVAKDKQIHNPKRVQWRCGPNHTRDHDALASISAMVSSRGKLFYIFDEGPTSQIHQPPEWKLIARDAFNGILLWKQPIRDWVTHLYSFRVGPVWLGRKLVAVEDRVYSTLALDAPVSALDADTGKTLLEYEGSEKTEEIAFHDGVLLLAVGDPGFMNSYAPKPNLYAEHKTDESPKIAKAVKAYDAKTGKLLWERATENLKHLVPLSLTAIEQKAFFMDNEKIFCVDLKTGKDLWQAPFGTTGLFIRNYTPTFVLSKEVAVCVSDEKMAAYSVKDGRKLWGKDQGFYGFASPADLFIIGDLVWTGHTCKGGLKDILGIDLKTGEVKRSFPENQILPGGHHHRCYRNKATERYLLMGRRCVEFVDLEGDEHQHNWHIRGICQYGIMPANGQLYVPPEPCRCFTSIKMNGFYSFVSENHADKVARDGERLFKSEHYADFVGAHAKGSTPPVPQAGKEKSVWSRGGIHCPSAEEWPTYRHDIARSGSVKANLPAKLTQCWKRSFNQKMGSLVCAGGKLYVPSNEQCTLRCLSADTGKTVWEYAAGGGVDSPPTLHNGLAIFGCRDGTVYAVDAERGDLIWRFRAGPVDSRIVADGRLESPWPVSGSVLVVGNTAYFAAGRSSFIDEGIFLYGLNATTGERICETVAQSQSPRPVLGKKAPGKAKGSPPSGALPDILVSDGSAIAMQGKGFSLDLKGGAKGKMLQVPYGLLNDTFMHRTSWTFGGGTSYKSPFGKLLVFDGDVAYGVQNRYSWQKFSPWMWPQDHTGHHHQKYSRYKPDMFPSGVRLFAQKNVPVADKKIETPNPDKIPKGFERWSKPAMWSPAGHAWTSDLSCQVRAMVATDRVLFAAGWKDSIAIYPELKTADTGRPVLLAFEKETGKQLAEYELPSPPAFDAMIAAHGKLFISLQNGDVLCFTGRAE